MRKSMSKKLVALTMGISMLCGGVVASADPITISSQGGESAALETDTSVSNPVYSLVVPTTSTVALDPMQMKANGESIVSGDFQIINNSEAPVVVTCTSYFSKKDGVDIVAKDAVPDGSDISDVSKKAYLQAVVAGDVTASATSPSSVIDKVEGNYTKKAEVPIAATSVDKATGTTMQFILAKATYNDTHDIQSSDKTSCAAYKLSGLINPNATWTASDIKVSTVYKMQGVTGAYYTENNVSDKLQENGYNLLKVTPKETVKGFVDNSGKALDTLIVDTSNANVEAKLNLEDGDTIAKVQAVNKNSGKVFEIAAAGYTYTSNKLTIVKGSSDSVANYIYNKPEEVSKIIVTTTKGSTYTLSTTLTK